MVHLKRKVFLFLSPYLDTEQLPWRLIYVLSYVQYSFHHGLFSGGFEYPSTVLVVVLLESEMFSTALEFHHQDGVGSVPEIT